MLSRLKVGWHRRVTSESKKLKIPDCPALAPQSFTKPKASRKLNKRMVTNTETHSDNFFSGACRQDNPLKNQDLTNPSQYERSMRALKAPCAPRHALPPHWQNVALSAWMACLCHFRCVPPRFGSRPCVRPLRLASGLLVCMRQSVHGPAQTRALVRHRLSERRAWPAVWLSRLSSFSLRFKCQR